MTTTFWNPDAVVLRVCHDCGEPWIVGQECCGRCNSQTFKERVEPPVIPEDTKPAEVRGWQ